jgi:hypothetical protein
MAYPDLDEARKQHAALKEIFFRGHGTEWAERSTLRTVEELCRRASAAVEDAHCREELGIVADYAREFFVDRNYRKWESESLSGSEFLRLQILKALDSFHSRLYSIEAIRRAGDYKPYLPPSRHPGL